MRGLRHTRSGKEQELEIAWHGRHEVKSRRHRVPSEMLQTRHAMQPACRTRGQASRRPTHETLEQLEAQMRCGVPTDIEFCRQIVQRLVKSAGTPIDQLVLRRTQLAYPLEAGRSPQGL